MDFIGLSKELSYILRHAPQKYQLKLDEDGWVCIDQLLNALQKSEKWKEIKKADLIEMIEKSEKKRHEISGNKIRAFYGHSVSAKIRKEEQEPPSVLYHGTARRFLDSIKKDGLLPKERQYVHLSQDLETAESVGKRRDQKPYILTIDAKKAWQNGIKFYYGNEKVWLSDAIPAQYILDNDLKI